MGGLKFLSADRRVGRPRTGKPRLAHLVAPAPLRVRGPNEYALLLQLEGCRAEAVEGLSDLLVRSQKTLTHSRIISALRGGVVGDDHDVLNQNLQSEDGRQLLCGLLDHLVDRVRDALQIDYLLPLFVAEGKSYLTMAIGCTGGRHRSVVIAEDLRTYLRQRSYDIRVYHRDIFK